MTLQKHLSHEQVEHMLRPVLKAESEEIFQFAVDVYHKCILQNICPPAPPLSGRYVRPGGEYGAGQWIWDTPFGVDLLALLPENRDLIREVFQNYWDFQALWDAATPEYAHGMISCQIKVGQTPDDIYASYSQIPTLAWGIERVFRRNQDVELVRTALRPLEHWHEWFWRERDVTNVGLVGVGNYTGAYRQAIYEPFDWESNLDEMKLTPHPSRQYAPDDKWYGVARALGMLAGPIHPLRMAQQRNWYGNILTPTNTAYLALAEASLARMAEVAGDVAMAARRRQRCDTAIEAMRTHMWDQQAGTFLAVWRDSMEKVRVPTMGGWIALHAGVPTDAMARRMAEVLLTPEWNTPLPICTVERNGPHYRVGDINQGGIWPPMNYQVADGLARYGYHELAAHFCDTIIANAMKQGVSEYYHCDTGAPLGVPNLNMSCTLVTMMLDGLSRRFVLQSHAGS